MGQDYACLLASQAQRRSGCGATQLLGDQPSDTHAHTRKASHVCRAQKAEKWLHWSGAGGATQVRAQDEGAVYSRAPHAAGVAGAEAPWQRPFC